MGEALDADLQSVYGLSLGDVAAGRVTMRRLRGLVAHLPADGTAMWRESRRSARGAGRAVQPGPDWWTPERDLLASIVDRLGQRLWQAGGGKGPAPLPIERPGHEAGRLRLGRPMPREEFDAIRERFGSRPGGRGEHRPEDHEVPGGRDDADGDSGDGEAAAALDVPAGLDEPADGHDQADDADPEQG